MGQAKRVRKFAEVKRVLSKKDARRRENAAKADEANGQKAQNAPASSELIREIPQQPSSMFFQHNEALVPPYSVLVDTNFLSHTVSRKIPLLEGFMDLLVRNVCCETSCLLTCVLFRDNVSLTQSLAVCKGQPHNHRLLYGRGQYTARPGRFLIPREHELTLDLFSSKN
ncbi:duf652 domain-containing protein [Seiridium cupressi]